MARIEIPLSKKKILLSIIGSFLFVILGLYFFMTADHQERYNPVFLKIVSVVCLLFFGATGSYGIKKMFDRNIGIIIDENGITDNTNATSIGLIKWSDITGIRTDQIMSTKFMLIFVKTPEVILGKANGIKRKLMESNMKMYGTPLSITATTLKYNFNDLEKLVSEKLEEFKAMNDPSFQN